MRSIFVGIIVVSSDDDLKAIERDNERNQLPATQDDITGAALVRSEENALTSRIDQDNARLDRLIRGVCPTC
jgi:hypothetical protein